MTTSNVPPRSGTEPSGKVRLVRIHEDRDGQRLDNFLFGVLKGAPKSLIYKIIRSGHPSTSTA